ETDLDMALLVERQQGIDSDLVAAIQFERPDASKWGSQQLERAVIEYVAAFSRGLNVLEGIPTEYVNRRSLALVASLAIAAVVAAMYPQYVATFFSRLAMSNSHYPTRTQIDEVQVNGAAVAIGDRPIHAGYAQSVEFAVQTSGEAPRATSEITLRTISSGVSSPLALAQESKSADGRLRFRAELPQLVDSLEFQVHAGDAWTEWTSLEVIPLAVVEPKLTATPPAYAQAAALAGLDKSAGSRQLSVLEGSRVDLEINCDNKPLIAAALSVTITNYDMDKKAVTVKKEFPLEKQDAEGRRWKLTAVDTPLAHVDSLLKYEIQVTDIDGLHLPHPLDGSIRIKPDRPPTVTTSVDVQYFLPNSGTPEISYTANDDYGISAMRLFVEVIHPGGSPETSAEPIPILKQQLAAPALKPTLPLTGIYRLPLEQFKLAKGDQVRLILEATDYRGDEPGKSTKSDPVVLQITDETGILAALSETDRHAYDQMNVLIQRQTQTGGLK
ncbi:MAG TPA: DUF4175 family protein, partial [Pirellulales bacterium]|nr:DUF4175 family protein [Pirellulales bacterium]